MQESFGFANEALEIAERCEYRLQEAEVNNFLAEWWKQTADDSLPLVPAFGGAETGWRLRTLEAAGQGQQTADTSAVIGRPSSVVEALAKAKEHAERAKERAWCDGPPYYYKVAWEKAESLLKEIANG